MQRIYYNVKIKVGIYSFTTVGQYLQVIVEYIAL